MYSLCFELLPIHEKTSFLLWFKVSKNIVETSEIFLRTLVRKVNSISKNSKKYMKQKSMSG